MKHLSKIVGLVFVCVIALILVACNKDDTETFTVTFVCETGLSINPATRTVAPGDTMAAPVVPARDGFIVGGWYLEPTFETPWNFLQDTVQSTKNLYLRWEAVTPQPGVGQFTLTFNVAGGVEIAAIIRDANSSVDLPTPVRVGYEFRGWTLNGNPIVTLSILLSADMTLVATWEALPPSIVSFTVTFDSAGGSAVESRTVVEGLTVALPPEPTKTGYTFAGWQLNGVAVTFPYLPATDVTLVATWNAIPPRSPYSITTAEELHAITVGNKTGNFYLLNDIDFAGFTGQFAEGTFSGTLDGRGFTIRNLSTNRTNGQQGLFQILGHGAIVENIIFRNANIEGNNAAGIIAREAGVATEAHTVIIRNIAVFDSRVSNTAGNGGAGLVGYSRAQMTVSNIYMYRVTIIAAGQFAGFIVGRVGDSSTPLERTITVNNINIVGGSVTAGERAGGIFGGIDRQRTEISNVVIQAVTISGTQFVAGIIGRNNLADGDGGNAAITSTINNVYFNGTITATGTEGNHLVGSVLTQRPIPLANMSNVFLVATTISGTPSSGNQVPALNNAATIVPSAVTSVWWLQNLPTIYNSDLWTLEGNMKMLEIGLGPIEVIFNVTFNPANGEVNFIRPTVAGNAVLAPAEPIRPGHLFQGWFLADAQTPFVLTTPITGAITLTARWQVDPNAVEFTATFYLAGGDGIAPSQTVFDGLVFVQPTAPTKAGYVFRGWQHDGEVWNFATIPTSSMNFVAYWLCIEEAGNVIVTAQQLHELTIGDRTGDYILGADIDFAGFEGIWQSGTFSGTLDGDGFTVRNLTQNLANNQRVWLEGNNIGESSQQGGLFQRLGNGAIIENINFVNVNITGALATGLIARELANDATATIRNITITTSNVINQHTAASNNGAGGLIAYIRGTLNVNNVVMDRFTVDQRSGDHAGFIVGRIGESTTSSVHRLNVTNVFITGSEVRGTLRVGGIGGGQDSPIRTHANAVVFHNTTIHGTNYVAIFIGRNNTTDTVSTFRNIVFNGTLHGSGSGRQGPSTLQGRNSMRADGFSNVFTMALVTPGSALGTGNNTMQTPDTNRLGALQPQSWWATDFLQHIEQPNLWMWNASTQTYALIR